MFALFREFLEVFGKGVRFKLVLLMLGAVVSGLLELIGILLILPFMVVATNSSAIHKHHITEQIYIMLGFTSDKSMLYLLAVLTGGAFIVKNMYMLYYQKKQFDFITFWKNKISEELMKKYLDLSYIKHLHKKSDQIINILSNIVAYSLNGFIFQMVNMASYIIVGICLITYMFAKFFIPAVLSSVILIFLGILQAKLIKNVAEHVNKEYVKAKETNFTVLRQSIEAIKETKMRLRENYYYEMFVKSNRQVTENDRKVIFVQYIPQFLTEIIIILGIITIICLVVYTGKGTADIIPRLGVLIAVAFRMAPVMNRALTCYSLIKSTTDATRKLIDEYRELEENKDDNSGCENIESIKPIEFKDCLELRDVSFAYDNKDVLKHINLKIKAGEFVGIVGASGAGKTTLVDILMGLLSPKDGQYLVDGKIVDRDVMVALRKQIGYVHQSIFIADGTVRDNIALGIAVENIDDEKVKESLRYVQLYDFFMEKETGLNTMLGAGGKGLSGGQRQRIAIARALYHDPAIIVLDEATSALDVETEHEVTTAINSLIKVNKTIIAIAHRLSTLKESDRIIFMNNSEIIDTGSFKELAANNASFANLIKLSDVRG